MCGAGWRRTARGRGRGREREGEGEGEDRPTYRDGRRDLDDIALAQENLSVGMQTTVAREVSKRGKGRTGAVLINVMFSLLSLCLFLLGTADYGQGRHCG